MTPQAPAQSGLQALLDLFPSPLWGDRHNPLVLGWSERQLLPVAERLQPYLPDGLTLSMTLAVAACARSLFVEHKLTGKPLRYSRAKEAYRVPKRYRCADPLVSWHYVTRAMDVLREANLIEHDTGVWCGAAPGRQSVAWPTDALATLLQSVVDEGEGRGRLDELETIVLRDREDKTDIDYADTIHTRRMRGEVEVINQSLGQLHLYRNGTRWEVPSIRRIFIGDFNRGGRLYGGGASHQNIPSVERANLRTLVDGVLHPMVEIDFGSLHIVMAYTEANAPMPSGDPYTIDGYDRKLVKQAVNTVLNARTQNAAIGAIANGLHESPGLRAHAGLRVGNWPACRSFAARLVRAIKAKHSKIAAHFGSDCGVRFQRKDSDIAVEVMLKMIRKTGRCPLPLHDSFLVPDIDKEALAQTMREVALRHRLPLALKDSDGLRWAAIPVPFQLEVTTSELHKCRAGERTSNAQRPLVGERNEQFQENGRQSLGDRAPPTSFNRNGGDGDATPGRSSVGRPPCRGRPPCQARNESAEGSADDHRC